MDWDEPICRAQPGMAVGGGVGVWVEVGLKGEGVAVSVGVPTAAQLALHNSAPVTPSLAWNKSSGPELTGDWLPDEVPPGAISPTMKAEFRLPSLAQGSKPFVPSLPLK
jgi:hypothetical protein